jgi:myosin heavy subunit
MRERRLNAEDEVRGVTGGVFEKVDIDNDLSPCREDLLGETVHDLLQLTILHDSTLLRCLYIRYIQKDLVYSNVGSIVVALNPFNFKIPH